MELTVTGFTFLLEVNMTTMSYGSNTVNSSLNTTTASDLNHTTLPVTTPLPATPPPIGYYGELRVTLWRVIPPIIMVWGTLGNVLTVLVLLRQKKALSSTGMYLMTLAVSDTIVLYTGPLRQWLKQTWDYDLRYQSDASCKISLYLTYASLHFSSWLLVAVTMERVLSVVIPHKVKLGCTPRNAGLTILITFIIIWGLNIVNPIIQGLDGYRGQKCDPTTERFLEFRDQVWNWIDFCVAFAVPFVILLFGNITIIVYLQRSMSKQKSMTTSRDKKSPTSGRDMTSVSVLMITLCVIFFLTMTPAAVFGLYQPHRFEQILKLFRTDPYAAWDANQYLLFQHAVVNLVSYTNASFNFILYVFSGTKFRNELFAMFLCRKPTKSGVFGSQAKTPRTLSSGKTTTTSIDMEDKRRGDVEDSISTNMRGTGLEQGSGLTENSNVETDVQHRGPTEVNDHDLCNNKDEDGVTAAEIRLETSTCAEINEVD